MYEQNRLACHLRQASENYDNEIFAREPLSGRVTSYGAFFSNAERVAAALVKAGVKPGDRVAAQVNKSLEALELYVGTVLAGGVFLPLNNAYTGSEISYFLGDAEPRVFVCDPGKQQQLADVANEAGVSTLWTLGSDGAGSLGKARELEAPGFQAVARRSDDLAAILYTSGTTGRSKGAMLSHEALASNADTLAQYWQFSADDVLIHALPIFHTHGLFVATNVVLMSRASMVFLPSFNADLILDNMPSATCMMGVPTFYVRLLEAEGLAGAARNMRLFVSGSAPLLAETHDKWREVTGHAILERYGMTETNMNTSNPYTGERRAGTVGFPLPGVELIVSNPETGEALEQGEIGIIEVRGANVFSGYWRMPEKTAEELRDNGFFITGDLGYVDDDGYVHIVGRSKDLIISGGYNVYPKEIELLIDDIPGVNESAVIGVPHPDFGEGVVAVVVTETAGSVDESTITAALAHDLARFKQPKKIHMVDALPRNTMGKVQKNLLRDQFAGDFSA